MCKMDTKRIDNISGRRLTFFKLINEYHIQIPIIQRDYAQGRASVIEIRESFLQSLHNYLSENVKNRDLDFVYGNQSNLKEDEFNSFIILDGQQRLTTLFLLHWYLANKDGKMDILRNNLLFNKDSDNAKSKFYYETRASSREFCDVLVKSSIDLNNLLKDDGGNDYSLSKTIKNFNWYFLSWDSDPTIKSMIEMLDSIHLKFKESSGFFERLISETNPIITFQFLDLEEFNLTDDLYIKMNARGIPLTSFESFKAKFEQYIESIEFSKENCERYKLNFNNTERNVSIKTYFSYKIDSDWSNLFWCYTLNDKKIYDDLIMNFIRAFTVNHYAGLPKTEHLKTLIDKETRNISFQQYLKYDCFDEKFITDIISFLDLVKNGNEKIKKYLDNFYYYDEDKIFETILFNKFNQAGYVERIKFHAYSQFLIKWQRNSDVNFTTALKNWMRLIHNLAENTIYNNENDFIRSIKTINILIPLSRDILNYLINGNEINGFDSNQLNEEKIKANLIFKSNEWEDQIYLIEQHNYFNGQIGFIIFCSGIDEYYKQHNNCMWSKDEDIIYLNNFKKYRNKATKIFNDSGLIDYPEYIWERALLSKDDYLIAAGRNHSFLINYHRDISWKRFLKGDKNEKHSMLLKEILDEIDVVNIQQSINNIIFNCHINDWRKKFIDTPELFKFLGPKRYIRKESNHGFVLFAGERMSRAHPELFSYSFFLNNMEDKIFNPFQKCYYYFALGEDPNDSPCVILDDLIYKNIKYSLEIYYLENIYELNFKSVVANNYSIELKEILEFNEFEFRNESYYLNLTEDLIIPKLLNICNDINNIL